MNRPYNIFKSRIWMMIWFLTALVAGCGERTANTDTASSPATVAASADTGLPAIGKGPAPVLLGTAGNYAILAKSTISTAGGSTVTGNIGVSSAIASHKGGLTFLAAPLQFSTSPQVYGHFFASDYAVQTPAKLAAAIFAMQSAYADAAGRKPDFTDLGSGIIGGMTLAPATYKWSTAVLIPTSITLSGGPDDVWIFQVAQGVIQTSDARVILIGGARAKNIFWQVAGAVEVGSAAHTEGVILSQSSITLGTGASANGRLLAQTTVSLDANAVTQPAP
jgi:hypothetical protein